MAVISLVLHFQTFEICLHYVYFNLLLFSLQIFAGQISRLYKKTKILVSTWGQNFIMTLYRTSVYSQSYTTTWNVSGTIRNSKRKSQVWYAYEDNINIFFFFNNTWNIVSVEPGLPGACNWKMPNSALRKDKIFFYSINFYRLIKKGQLPNKFSKISRPTNLKKDQICFLGLEKTKHLNLEPGNPVLS